MARPSKSQIKEKEVRKKLFKMCKSFERLKQKWNKIFDEAYPDDKYNWLWKQVREAEIYFEMLPEWEKEMLRGRIESSG